MDKFLIGFMTGAIVFGLIIGIVKTCSNIPALEANEVLNDPNYAIDTTMIIHNSDTTYSYEFINLTKITED